MLTICVPQCRCDAPHSRLYNCCFDMLIITAKLSNVLRLFESPMRECRRRRRSGARKSFICAFGQHYASSRELRIKIQIIESAIRKCRFQPLLPIFNYPYQSFSGMPGKVSRIRHAKYHCNGAADKSSKSAVNVIFIGTVLINGWALINVQYVSLLPHHHLKRPDLQFMPLQLDARDS